MIPIAEIIDWLPRTIEPHGPYLSVPNKLRSIFIRLSPTDVLKEVGDNYDNLRDVRYIWKLFWN